jgi:hypothetical protein
MVVAVFVLGFLTGVAVCVATALLVERSRRANKPVVTGIIRHPTVTLRLWLDPNYRAVTRDLRRVFGE